MAGEDKAGQNSLGGSGLLIAIGRLGRPHGVRGEIRLKLFFGFDHVYALAGKAVVLKGESEQSGRTACLAGAREISGGYCLLVLEGVSSPESAREFSNLLLMAPKNILPALPEGHYYHEEIVGLPVFDPDGGKIGRLAGFFEAGGADVWVIESVSGEEILTPCLPETLLDVDIEKGRIVMRLMEME